MHMLTLLSEQEEGDDDVTSRNSHNAAENYLKIQFSRKEGAHPRSESFSPLSPPPLLSCRWYLGVGGSAIRASDSVFWVSLTYTGCRRVIKLLLFSG